MRRLLGIMLMGGLVDRYGKPVETPLLRRIAKLGIIIGLLLMMFVRPFVPVPLVGPVGYLLVLAGALLLCASQIGSNRYEQAAVTALLLFGWVVFGFMSIA